MSTKTKNCKWGNGCKILKDYEDPGYDSHMKSYVHPPHDSDSDSDDGKKITCKYGSGCKIRSNKNHREYPSHMSKYSHEKSSFKKPGRKRSSRGPPSGMSSSHGLPSHGSPRRESLIRRSSQKKIECKWGHDCNIKSNKKHKDYFVHINKYSHPTSKESCKYGTECTINGYPKKKGYEYHMKRYQHPITKTFCRNGSYCEIQWNSDDPEYKQHMSRYSHPQRIACKYKEKCKIFLDSGHSKHKEHCLKYSHPEPLPKGILLKLPDNWDAFESGNVYKEVELVDNPKTVDEYTKMVKIFTDGGLTPTKIISLKRIQHFSLFLTFEGQRKIIQEKKCNGGTAKEMYLFHGAKTNTDAILKKGFVAQHANSKPYGIWFSTKSSYSGVHFAETLPDGSKRIFIARVVIGTIGKDDGTGRRPNKVSTGELADCHHNGSHVYIIYEDRQGYPEYLIHWK